MILNTSTAEATTIVELKNRSSLANGPTEFEIDGFKWQIIYESKAITMTVLSNIAPDDSVQLIVNCSNGDDNKTITAEVSDSEKQVTIDWSCDSDNVQLEIDQIIYQKQLPGNDFSIAERFSDVELIVEEEHFHVHSIILGTVSPYFKTLFYGKFTEAVNLSQPISLKGMSSTSFQSFLNCIYVYPSNFRITRGNIGELLLALSHYFDCQKVLALCEMHLLTNARYDNFPIIQLAEWACHYNLSNLKENLRRNHPEELRSMAKYY